MYKIQYIRK